jgi:hypothetical protein
VSDGPGDAPLRVTQGDLYTEKVEEWLQREQAIRAVPEQVEAQPPGPFAFLLNSVVYTSLAGLVGGIIGWCILEPVYTDQSGGALDFALNIFFFPIVGMAVAGSIAAVEGIVTRNPGRAFRQGVIAMAISFGLCLAGGWLANVFYAFGQQVMASLFGGGEEGPALEGGAFFAQMVLRGLAWAVAGLCVGVSQGLAAKSKKVFANGLVGGLVGGLLGGLLFDPVDRIVIGDEWFSGERTQGAEISRCVGIAMVGLLVGFFLGLVENLAKDAWLYMKAGPLRGKQFILYNDPTVVGSSPKCHVYIFKDPAVEPRHATLSVYGGRHQLKDLGTPAGVSVNGRKVTSHVLASGDRIQIGETVLEYGQKVKA